MENHVVFGIQTENHIMEGAEETLSFGGTLQHNIVLLKFVCSIGSSHLYLRKYRSDQ